MTHDVDLVLALTDTHAAAIIRAFPEADFYVPPIEVVRIELRRSTHGHFNLIHHDTGFKADIYLAGRDPLHAWATARRKRAGNDDDAFWVAPPEYVICASSHGTARAAPKNTCATFVACSRSRVTRSITPNSIDGSVSSGSSASGATSHGPPASLDVSAARAVRALTYPLRAPGEP